MRSEPSLPPERTLTQDVADTLTDYLATRAARDEARASCTRDWAYFGHEHEVRLDRDLSRFGEALDRFVGDFIARCQHDPD